LYPHGYAIVSKKEKSMQWTWGREVNKGPANNSCLDKQLQVLRLLIELSKEKPITSALLTKKKKTPVV
jgi:hypothetical protein